MQNYAHTEATVTEVATEIISLEEAELFKAIGNAIRQKRLSLGISTQQFALMCQMSVTQVDLIENGKGFDIPAALISNIARSLATTPSELLGIAESELEPGLEK